MTKLPHLNEAMQHFISRQEMMWIATTDAKGESDCSFRGGPRGFVRVIDERRLAYPEYRGNGARTTLANIAENAHVGLLFLDLLETTAGLHVSGRARVLEPAELLKDK